MPWTLCSCSWTLWLWRIHCGCTIWFSRLHLVYRLAYSRIFIIYAAASICKFAFRIILHFIDFYDAHKLNLFEFRSFDAIPYILYSINSSSKGNPFIYHVLNWNTPKKAMVTVFGTLILSIIVHSALFWVYKFRMFIQRSCFSTNLILPTTTSSKQRLAKTTMGSSQISMVFGENDGCTNQAFRTQS